MDPAFIRNNEIEKKLIELSEKLRISEEERLKLEAKYYSVLKAKQIEKPLRLESMRSKYEAYIRADGLRSGRNESIIETLKRIESRATTITAKSDRLKLLRQHYESYVEQFYPVLKKNRNISEVCSSTLRRIDYPYVPGEVLKQSFASYESGIEKSSLSSLKNKILLDRKREVLNIMDLSTKSIPESTVTDNDDIASSTAHDTSGNLIPINRTTNYTSSNPLEPIVSRSPFESSTMTQDTKITTQPETSMENWHVPWHIPTGQPRRGRERYDSRDGNTYKRNLFEASSLQGPTLPRAGTSFGFLNEGGFMSNISDTRFRPGCQSMGYGSPGSFSQQFDVPPSNTQYYPSGIHWAYDDNDAQPPFKNARKSPKEMHNFNNQNLMAYFNKTTNESVFPTPIDPIPTDSHFGQIKIKTEPKETLDYISENVPDDNTGYDSVTAYSHPTEDGRPQSEWENDTPASITFPPPDPRDLHHTDNKLPRMLEEFSGNDFREDESYQKYANAEKVEIKLTEVDLEHSTNNYLRDTEAGSSYDERGTTDFVFDPTKIKVEPIDPGYEEYSSPGNAASIESNFVFDPSTIKVEPIDTGYEEYAYPGNPAPILSDFEEHSSNRNAEQYFQYPSTWHEDVNNPSTSSVLPGVNYESVQNTDASSNVNNEDSYNLSRIKLKLEPYIPTESNLDSFVKEECVQLPKEQIVEQYPEEVTEQFYKQNRAEEHAEEIAPQLQLSNAESDDSICNVVDSTNDSHKEIVNENTDKKLDEVSTPQVAVNSADGNTNKLKNVILGDSTEKSDIKQEKNLTDTTNNRTQESCGEQISAFGPDISQRQSYDDILKEGVFLSMNKESTKNINAECVENNESKIKTKIMSDVESPSESIINQTTSELEGILEEYDYSILDTNSVETFKEHEFSKQMPGFREETCDMSYEDTTQGKEPFPPAENFSGEEEGKIKERNSFFPPVGGKDKQFNESNTLTLVHPETIHKEIITQGKVDNEEATVHGEPYHEDENINQLITPDANTFNTLAENLIECPSDDQPSKSKLEEDPLKLSGISNDTPINVDSGKSLDFENDNNFAVGDSQNWQGDIDPAAQFTNSQFYDNGEFINENDNAYYADMRSAPQNDNIYQTSEIYASQVKGLEMYQEEQYMKNLMNPPEYQEHYQYYQTKQTDHGQGYYLAQEAEYQGYNEQMYPEGATNLTQNEQYDELYTYEEPTPNEGHMQENEDNSKCEENQLYEDYNDSSVQGVKVEPVSPQDSTSNQFEEFNPDDSNNGSIN